MSNSVTAQQAAWVARVLGIEATANPAMQAWGQARATAIGSINALVAKVSALDHPQRDEAVILLRAIRANLTADPSTPQQVGALRRYLETDDVIDEAEEPNGFGIEITLRAPLLAALAGLE